MPCPVCESTELRNAEFIVKSVLAGPQTPAWLEPSALSFTHQGPQREDTVVSVQQCGQCGGVFPEPSIAVNAEAQAALARHNAHVHWRWGLTRV